VWLPVTVITLLTTVLVMGCVGQVTQAVLRLQERRRGSDD
jgi:putative effector of murein hydrolase LrgA (UPF0299 family)